MKPIAIWALALFITCPLASVAQEQSVIRLAEIEGRTWLITPEGKPFFPHGITHVTNRDLRTNYNAVSKACKDLGFNAYGYGCPTELKSDMPYLEGRNYVPISTYLGRSFRFIDIFDPREQKKLTEQVKQRCLENRDNPYLIGYYWTDLGAWPLKNSVGKNWVDFIRDLRADAPGHKAYAEFLKTWKGGDEKARDLGFLRVIAREYFRVMGEANRKHDPDHLIFGDRFGFNTIVPEVLEEMLPWVDAIAIQPPFQPGFPKAKYQEIHELTGKPILICDFAIRFKDGDKSIRGWKLQENAQVAGVHYAKYIRAALETPFIIGAFWCNPIDSTPAYNKTGIKQGLFGEGLKPRPGLGETVIELNRHIERVTPGGRAAGLSGSKRSTAAAADTSDDDSPVSHDAASDPRTSSLLKALNLTDEQKPKFLAIQKAMSRKWAELQKLPAEERKTEQEAFFKARHEEIAKLLTPAQLKTYREFQQARKKRAQQQKPTQQTSTSEAPRRSTPSRPVALRDYSGNDVAGIETIVEESRQSDSPWRQKADERIDQLRKAHLEIRVVDADGNPLEGVPVHVQQQRHLFRFGGVVRGPMMHGTNGGQQRRRMTADRNKKMFLELGFNTAGFGNYLKYKNREQSAPYLPDLFAWFEEHNIPVRGHCLIWPGGGYGNYLPDELGKIVYQRNAELDRLIRQGKTLGREKREPRQSLTQKEAQSVREISQRMIEEASKQWPVYEWDVINETRSNHLLQDLVGKDVIVDWFKIARQHTRDRNALLYLNENRVISDPAAGEVTRSMKLFEEEVNYLLENGAPISGLGFQSRFAKSIPPETLYKRLEYFEKYNLPIAATEFEMKEALGSELDRAAMTEQAMTVLFSHRLVNGIYAWTILEGALHGDRAIVNRDGSLNLRGKVWMHLMKNRWWTDQSLTTDANGKVTLRGFKGDYIVIVGKGAGSKSMELRLDDDRKAEVKVKSAQRA